MSRPILIALALAILPGCQGVAHPPLALASNVDLPRFMGDWYVIASIPTFIERDAFNAIESYRQDGDGSIATTFTFRAGAFDGPLKTYNPRGFVVDTKTNAVWDMRFVWPFLADYRIVDVAPDYSLTIIGREKRDYAWIMARTPAIPDADYERAVRLLAVQGYDVAQLRKVPQQWNSAK